MAWRRRSRPPRGCPGGCRSRPAGSRCSPSPSSSWPGLPASARASSRSFASKASFTSSTRGKCPAAPPPPAARGDPGPAPLPAAARPGLGPTPRQSPARTPAEASGGPGAPGAPPARGRSFPRAARGGASGSPSGTLAPGRISVAPPGRANEAPRSPLGLPSLEWPRREPAGLSSADSWRTPRLPASAFRVLSFLRARFCWLGWDRPGVALLPLEVSPDV